MLPSDRKLQSRFRGALLGCAVGDGLGFPYQDYSRSFMRSLLGPLTASFARHHSGFYPIGQYTDDTQMAQAVAEAIIEAGAVDGQAIAEHLIPLWRDQLVVDRSAACTEAMERLVRGEVAWDQAGLPAGRVESGALPRALPVALWSHSNPESLPAEVETVCLITHRDPRAIAAAAAVAAGLAHNLVQSDLILGTFLDQAAQAAGRFYGELAEAILDFPRILSQTEYRAFESFGAFVAGAVGDRPPAFDEGVVENSLHTTLAALYYFLKNPFDFERAVESSLRAGGDVDTSCALIGALSGGLLGVEAIPAGLAGSVLDGGVILDRADRLLLRWRERRGPKE
jgi:ADP-ribosylglycohydrolase